MSNVGIITQARMTSTRLPGKILLQAKGITVLEYHINRLLWSNLPVYIATTRNNTDEPVVELANLLHIPYYRGDEINVLQRFFECAEKFKLDIIIRVTSDCPLIDGHLIAKGLGQYLNFHNKNIYYSNCMVRTFPRGLDFEIFSFDLLRNAYLNATEESDKEHVTPYINQNRSKMTNIAHYNSNKDHSNLRWTLDTAEDWRLIKILFEHYHVANLEYEEILKIFQQNPELTTINNHIIQKGI